jgi:hypothetical protein
MLAVTGIIAAVSPIRAIAGELQGEPSIRYRYKSWIDQFLTIDDVSRMPEHALRKVLMESVLFTPCRLRSAEALNQWKQDTIRAAHDMRTWLYNNEDMIVVDQDTDPSLGELALQPNVAGARRRGILWTFLMQVESAGCK